MNDVFALEAELTQSIARHLGANVSAPEALAIQERPTKDLSAYDVYTHARNLVLMASFSERGREDLLQAADLLNKAVAADPSFFQAYCELAKAHRRLYLFGFDPSSARLGMAEAAVETAAHLRPEAGETHLARAENLYAGYLNYNGALTELEVARKNLPNDARIFQLMGYVQRRQGHWEESTRNLEHAAELNPRDLEILQQTAMSYGLFRRYSDETDFLDRACAVEPTQIETKIARAFLELDRKADTHALHQAIDDVRSKNPNSVNGIASEWLIDALAEHDATAAKDALIALGETPLQQDATVRFSRPFIEGLIARMTRDDKKARAAFTIARTEQEKIVQDQPDFGPSWCVLGLIDAALGRKEDALREAQHAVELSRPEKDAIRGPAMIKYLAMIAEWAGDKDLACEQLAVAVRPPSYVGFGELKLLPWWDPLRGDPRFEKIVASLAPKTP